MRVLIAGAGFAWIYEDALLDAFKKLSVEADVFRWWRYFKFSPYKTEYDTIALKLQRFYFKFQKKFLVGPAIFKINCDLIRYVKKTTPDLIFIYRGTHIFPATIRKLRQNGSVVFGYNNDDPFSGVAPKYVHRHFIKSLPQYNWIFAFRHKNLDDYSRLGFNNTSLLRSYYIQERHFYIKELPTQKYSHDVVFIGHFESDGREEYIKCLMEDERLDFNLYGTLWDRSKYAKEIRDHFGEIKPLYDDYNLAINSAKIALAFLSKRNNDTYTRRCFEIVAAKTFMLSEYTDDLDSMFKEGVEAEYFRDKEEMMDKIRFYLRHDDKREKIARTGHERLLRDGHEVTDRARDIIRIFERLKEER
jgi:spore maturation protein CgeB